MTTTVTVTLTLTVTLTVTVTTTTTTAVANLCMLLQCNPHGCQGCFMEEGCCEEQGEDIVGGAFAAVCAAIRAAKTPKRCPHMQQDLLVPAHLWLCSLHLFEELSKGVQQRIVVLGAEHLEHALGWPGGRDGVK